jgi:hypothetical protein
LKNIYPNRINSVIRARIKSLINQIEESKYVDHSSSKGTLREKYLIQFLENLFPKDFSVSGGFICDVTGKISLQQDLILTDRSKTPLIFLTDDISLIPIEVAISSIEVKSSISTSDFKQIKSQILSIKNLQPITEQEWSGVHGVRHFIFAYESQISEEIIKNWFQELPQLFGICILGKAYYFRSSNKTIEAIINDEFSETLVFVSSLLHSIVKAGEERPSFTINIWRKYFTGVNPLNIELP